MHRFSRVAVALIVLTVACVLRPSEAVPHPGGLDSSGCHNDRRSGGYHCHRSRGGGGGGGGGGAPTTRKLKVTTLPKAKVWVNGEYLGVSPTKWHTTSFGAVDVRLEHPFLGEYTRRIDVVESRTNMHLRW